MKLDAWRRQKKLSVAQLAALLDIVGQNPTRTAQRYLTEERIPDRATMRRISQVTEGNVTDEDFPIHPQRREPCGVTQDAA